MMKQERGTTNRKQGNRKQKSECRSQNSEVRIQKLRAGIKRAHAFLLSPFSCLLSPEFCFLSSDFILHRSYFNIFLSGFFQSGILFDELLLSEAGETDGQLGGVARAFAAQDEAAPVLRVTDVRARREARVAGRRRGCG